MGALSPAGHKLAIAVIAMSLLVSPIWFLMARVMHRLILSHASILGFDLAGLRLWSRAPEPKPALASADIAVRDWDRGA